MPQRFLLMIENIFEVHKGVKLIKDFTFLADRANFADFD